MATKARKSRSRAMVWRITGWRKLYELPDSMTSYFDRAPQYLQSPVARSDEPAIGLRQRLDRIGGWKHREFKWAYCELREIAANHGKQARGYLVSPDLRAAEGKQIAEWLEMTPQRAAVVLKRLSELGLIERVRLPDFNAPVKPPRARKTGKTPVNRKGAGGRKPGTAPRARKTRRGSAAQNAAEGVNGGRLRPPLVAQSEVDKSESLKGSKGKSEVGRSASSSTPPPAQNQNETAEGQSPKASPKPNAESQGQGEPPARSTTHRARPSTHAERQAEALRQIAEMKGQEQRERQRQAMSPPQAGMPTVPILPTVSDAPQGGAGATSPAPPGCSVARPHSRGRSQAEPLGNVLAEVMAQYSPDAQAFARQVYAALGTPYDPESREGHREMGNFATAWQLAVQAGRGDIATHNKAVAHARVLNTRRKHTRWRISPEAVWRSKFNGLIKHPLSNVKAYKTGS